MTDDNGDPYLVSLNVGTSPTRAEAPLRNSRKCPLNVHSAFGLVPSVIGLGAGYALSSSVMIGGKLAHAETADSSATSLLPFLDLSLGTGWRSPRSRC